MAQGYTTRKLELFSVHLKGLSPLDYAGFFRRMASAELLQEDIGGDRVVFIVPRSRKDGLAAFVAYEGEQGVRPLIFSKSEVEERVQVDSDSVVLCADASRLRRAAVAVVASLSAYGFLNFLVVLITLSQAGAVYIRHVKDGQ